MFRSSHATIPALVALAFLAAACASTAHAPTPGDSGLEGLVTIGPMCPVVQADTPCPDQPFQATIVVVDEGGDEVATVESGADGRFRVNLEPGRYTLAPQSPNPGAPPFAGEQEVEVEEGAVTEVTIQYDSGIR